MNFFLSGLAIDSILWFQKVGDVGWRDGVYHMTPVSEVRKGLDKIATDAGYLRTPPPQRFATLTPPRLQVEASDEIEGETERVGDAPASADAADAGDSADASSDSE